MITILILSIGYVLGFFISIYVLHRFKDVLEVNDYDPPHVPYYDDYSSNAQAYASFSTIWPIFWVVKLLFWIGNLIYNLSVKVGKIANKKTNESN